MNTGDLDYAGFVRLVLEALDAAGVEYLIGGAVAAWAWGEPRSTLDIDLVVNIPADAIGRLSQELERRDMLVPVEVILDSLIDERADIPIHAIHASSGFKADLYPLRPGDVLRQTAFQRRKKVDLGPRIGEVYLHSPEDLILYKLSYFSLSQQSKHIRDISAIILSLGDELDLAYLEAWAERKGLLALWQEILRKVQNR
jgi:hypothetical protein